MPNHDQEIFEEIDAIMDDVSVTMSRLGRSMSRIFRRVGEHSPAPTDSFSPSADTLLELARRKVSTVRVGSKFYSISVIEIPDPKLKQERNHTV